MRCKVSAHMCGDGEELPRCASWPFVSNATMPQHSIKILHEKGEVDEKREKQVRLMTSWYY